MLVSQLELLFYRGREDGSWGVSTWEAGRVSWRARAIVRVRVRVRVRVTRSKSGSHREQE
jgi:hypothetical protein